MGVRKKAFKKSIIAAIFIFALAIPLQTRHNLVYNIFCIAFALKILTSHAHSERFKVLQKGPRVLL